MILSINRFRPIFSMTVDVPPASRLSSSTFNRIQTFHAVPAVKELWQKMKEEIWQTLKEEDLVLCGDARMDSPGFSAKYCVYVLMDHHLSIITDLEIAGLSAGLSAGLNFDISENGRQMPLSAQRRDMQVFGTPLQFLPKSEARRYL